MELRRLAESIEHQAHQLLQHSKALYEQADRLEASSRMPLDQQAELLQKSAEKLKHNRVEQAIDEYDRAAALYESAQRPVHVDLCSIESAKLLATMKQYPTAINRLLAVAERGNVDLALVHQFAILCMLANGDIERAQKLSHPGPFLTGILDAVQKQDRSLFTDVVVEQDSIKPIDNWTTRLLYTIKFNIKC